jgi:SAM-dependent methyltransferase
VVVNPETAWGNLRTWYQDPDLLRSRQQHRTNPDAGLGFVEWLLDMLPLAGVHTILDAGAGVGRFTRPLAVRCQELGIRVVAGDLFPGMVTAIREATCAEGVPVDVAVVDIERLPFVGDAFDLVLANHVLYHLPDIDRGVRELARVTARGGLCVATTNAENIPIPVIDLHHAVLDRLGVRHDPDPRSSFSLDNGEERMRVGFREVELRVYESRAVFDTPAMLVDAYQTTGRFRSASGEYGLPAADLARVAAEVCAKWFTERGGRVVGRVLMGAYFCRGAS